MKSNDKGSNFDARDWWQRLPVWWRLLLPAVLLTSLVTPVQPLQAQQPLTWELVHGREQTIDICASQPTGGEKESGFQNNGTHKNETNWTRNSVRGSVDSSSCNSKAGS